MVHDNLKQKFQSKQETDIAKYEIEKINSNYTKEKQEMVENVKKHHYRAKQKSLERHEENQAKLQNDYMTKIMHTQLIAEE